MPTPRRTLTVSLGLLLVVAVACSFTTAHISKLKLGKDKSASQEASTFATDDIVYAVATISNAGKVKVKGRLVVEDVPGQKTGPVPGLETTVELPGSGTATFTFSPPPSGWPNGKYKIEVMMMNEAGEQKDEKTATFTVS